MPNLTRRALSALPLAALPGLAAAQAFPAKPVRLICPFPPGGAVDIASRAVAAEMSKTLGQPVTVENKPGAGGNIGGAEAARSAPDGYTLFMTTSGISAILFHPAFPVDIRHNAKIFREKLAVWAEEQMS